VELSIFGGWWKKGEERKGKVRWEVKMRRWGEALTS